MENASQSLIIAGGILMAIIVLTVGVYLFVNYSKVSGNYGQLQINKEINKFNTNFTKYLERTDIAAQEIITLKNFVRNYNKQNETDVEVELLNVSNTMEDVAFIKEYSVNDVGEKIYFECENIYYDTDGDGRVTKIEFKKID